MGTRSFLFIILTFWLSIPMLAEENVKDSLLQLLRTPVIPSEKIIILNQLASEYLDSEPLLAENYASQALLIAESIQERHGKAEANYYLGYLAQKEKKNRLASEYLLKAKEGFIDERDEAWLARVYLLLSDQYKRNMEFKDALDLLFRAREVFIEKGLKKELAITYNSIGGNYYDQENYEKAYENFAISLDLFIELNETQYIGNLYNNIGEIYRLNKDYVNALSYYNRAMSIFLEFNDLVKLALIYDNLGSAYFENNNLDSASHYLDLARKISDFTGDMDRMSAVRISQGLLARRTGDRKLAYNCLLMAYELAEKVPNYPNMLRASLNLSELYEENSDYEKAYSYFMSFRNIDDSIHDTRSLEKITEMEMSLLYELENEVRHIKIQRTNLWYFTLAFVLVSIILLITLLYGRQRIKILQARTLGENLQIEKRQLQEDIDHKNRELATNVMFLVKKNELINFISEKLMRAKIDFKPSVRKSVDEILMELQSNLNDNIWVNFEERFREVHKDFYNNLVAKFPNLTENDKKLCAFIRLNLNTKEIAAITHQNPSSIEVARTRLRKKLNISNTEVSLNGFLSTI